MKSSLVFRSHRLYILTALGLLLFFTTSSDLVMADPVHCFLSQCYFLGYHAGALQANEDWNNNNNYDTHTQHAIAITIVMATVTATAIGGIKLATHHLHKRKARA